MIIAFREGELQYEMPVCTALVVSVAEVLSHDDIEAVLDRAS
jgi:hypothetical protein